MLDGAIEQLGRPVQRVVRQLGELPGREPLERARDAAVQRPPLGSAELAVQHLAEQRVAERRRRPPRSTTMPARAGLREARPTTHAASRPAPRPAAADRCTSPATAARSSNARVSAGHAIEALADHVAHAVRDHALRDRLGALLVPEAHHLF